MIHLFCGHDPREAVGWHVFVSSVLERTSTPVAIHRLESCGLPQGSNAFTLSRFLVPFLMGYRGRAIFADGADMLALADIAELDALFDPSLAVQVVPHDYRTRNPRKYIGTAMECDNLDYPRKNQASLMLINCAHRLWSRVTPYYLETIPRLHMLQLSDFYAAQAVGFLPDTWNRIVDEGQPLDGAKLIHFTAGVPCFPGCGGLPGADLWFRQLATVRAGLQ